MQCEALRCKVFVLEARIGLRKSAASSWSRFFSSHVGNPRPREESVTKSMPSSRTVVRTSLVSTPTFEQRIFRLNGG